MDPRSLLLLDGTAELYRSFYAFKDLRTKTNVPTGAAFGFVLALQRLLDAEKPTHAAVAFDLPEATFRHVAYAEYKATRKPTPPELIAQIPVIKKIVTAYAIPVIEVSGFEADDVIATLVRMARKESVDVTIVAQDKDFYQLLDDGVWILNQKKGRLDRLAAEQLLGIPPGRIPDLLALMGDSSDNIPGVDGIGEKGAKKLISEFGTIDAVYQNLDKVGNPKVKARLENQRERAYLSYALALMHHDVPIERSFEALTVGKPDNATLCRIFESLEFMSLAAKFRPAEPVQRSLFGDLG